MMDKRRGVQVQRAVEDARKQARLDFVARFQRELSSLRSDWSLVDNFCFSSIWSHVLEGLAPDLTVPSSFQGRNAFTFCAASVLSGLKFGPHVEDRPPWLTPARLERLVREADGTRPKKSGRLSRASYEGVGPVATELVNDAAFLGWVEERAGMRISRRIKNTFIHYHRPGHFLPLHVDTPEWEINCLIGLRHTRPRGTKKHSILRLFTTPDVPMDISISPGRAVLFHAQATPHGRTPVRGGEYLSLLSLGFMPQ